MNAECGIRSEELNGFDQFHRDGFQVIGSLISNEECDHLAAELTGLFKSQNRESKGRRGGARNLLRSSPLISQFAKSPRVVSLMQQAAGFEAFPVRAIFFDKNPNANWLVPWHQDLAIAVSEKIEAPYFTGWSVKDGAWHVHPPAGILTRMLTLRVHLDDCRDCNGALKVIAGSHRAGKFSADEISKWTKTHPYITCESQKGGALLMRPLILHASSPAQSPTHRRVLHIEYATEKLPNGLEWLDN